MADALTLSGVRAGYGETIILEDVSFNVPERGAVAVLGRNGVGKTTLLATIMGHTTFHAGTIHFNGKDITKDNAGQIARQGIVRSFQISAVFPKLTVLENVRVALQRKAGLATQFWRSEQSLHKLDAAAMQLLEDVDLASFANASTVNAGTASAQTTANGPYYAIPSWDQTLTIANRFVATPSYSRWKPARFVSERCRVCGP